MSSYRFEEDFLNDEYERALRFDEGEIYQSEEYTSTVNRRTIIFDYLISKYAMYIDDIEKLLYEYENAFYDKMELEAMHYFNEGYIAGTNERSAYMDAYHIPYERLAKLRTERGLSQKDVAEFVGVTLNMYRKYESGERDYPIRVLLKLVELYGTTSNYILGWGDDK